MLIMRLIHHLSFQPRLAVISGTLARMLPDLLNYAAVLVLVLTMLAALLTLVWGQEIGAVSNMNSALIWMLQYFVTGLGRDVLYKLTEVSLGGSGGGSGGLGAQQARPPLHTHACMLGQWGSSHKPGSASRA